MILFALLLWYFDAPWWMWIGYVVEAVAYLGFLIQRQRTDLVVKNLLERMTNVESRGYNKKP